MGWRSLRKSMVQQRRARRLLEAYTLAGPCQPRLLPRIGITEGNRQALTLGMTMPQLIDPERFNPAVTLWTGDAPDGERLKEYVAEEVKHEPHHGETPIGVSDETVDVVKTGARSRAGGRAVCDEEQGRVRARGERYARHCAADAVLQREDEGRGASAAVWVTITMRRICSRRTRCLAESVDRFQGADGDRRAGVPDGD